MSAELRRLPRSADPSPSRPIAQPAHRPAGLAATPRARGTWSLDRFVWKDYELIDVQAGAPVVRGNSCKTGAASYETYYPRSFSPLGRRRGVGDHAGLAGARRFHGGRGVRPGVRANSGSNPR